jgi:hypothetical protein
LTAICSECGRTVPPGVFAYSSKGDRLCYSCASAHSFTDRSPLYLGSKVFKSYNEVRLWAEDRLWDYNDVFICSDFTVYYIQDWAGYRQIPCYYVSRGARCISFRYKYAGVQWYGRAPSQDSVSTLCRGVRPLKHQKPEF